MTQWFPLRARGAAAIPVLLLACADAPFSRGDTKIVYDTASFLNLRQAQDLPTNGCIGPVARTATVREVGSVMPEGARKRAQPQDSGWAPVTVADVATLGDRFAVVDEGVPSLTVFDAKLRRIWSLEKRGNGPGEFQAPARVRVDPRGDTLWVLDNGRHLLMAFSSDGRPQRTISVPSDVVGFDLTPRGSILLSHLVLPSRVRSEAVVVSRLEHNGTVTPAISYSRTAIRAPQFVLPGPNRPLVQAIGNFVAIIFPAAGVVDLYRQNANGSFQVVRTVAGCMPDDLRRAYDKQLAERRNPQSSVGLIADVALRGDTLLVIGSNPDASRRYGIQRFLVTDGRNIGAVALSGDRRVLPEGLRFRSRAGLGLTAFDSFQGYVALLDVIETKGER